jgi:KEOPS complex subunit Pcc1
VSLVHEATYVFEYPDERTARAIGDAVANEVGEIDDERSRATVTRTGRTLEVRVDARDLVALRAATNTWIGLVAVAERTLEAATSTPGRD